MSFRKEIREAVEQARFEELEELIAEDSATVRHLLGMTYSAKESVRTAAARGISIAAQYHPAIVEKTIRRLIWAMNDEAGTNGLTAPAVLEVIAVDHPELIVPVIPDLLRLRGDPGLRDGIVRTLQTTARSCPDQVRRLIGAQVMKNEIEKAAISADEESDQ